MTKVAASNKETGENGPRAWRCREVERVRALGVLQSDTEPLEHETVPTVLQSDTEPLEHETVPTVLQSVTEPLEHETVPTVLQSDTEPLEHETVPTAVASLGGAGGADRTG
ncbi:hypothetical protein Btru_060181 [Bulinus truncatus]|nr:hypothetical protein Btru_060181 [Bulinus truncatus]